MDETRVPSKTKDPVTAIDPLEVEATPALGMESGLRMFTSFPVRCEDVHFFLYTVHLPSAGIAQKTGAVVLRRGARQYTLLTYLFQTQLILGVTSPVLTELLQLEKLLLPKTSSKATKIRKLMTCDAVKAAIGEDILAMIESKLLSQEKKRKKNGDKADENAEGCDDQEAEDAVDELGDDPAAVACQQLLHMMDKEDEEDEEEKDRKDALLSETKDGDQKTKEEKDEAQRASRAFMSKVRDVPEWLVQKYPPPTWGTIHHIVHRDSSLPLFQAKLLGQEFFEGKNSCSASYNPDLAAESVNERLTLPSTLKPSERSMAQAYFMTVSWLKRAKEQPVPTPKATGKRKRATRP